jgi:hypothetical protein
MSIVLKDGTVLPDIPTAYTDEQFIGVAPDLATLKYHDVFFNSHSGIYFLTCSDIPAVCIGNDGYLYTLLIDLTSSGLSKNYTTFQFLPDSGASSWTEINSGLVSNNDYNWIPTTQGGYVWADYDINFHDPETLEFLSVYFPSSVKPPFILPDGTELPALPDGWNDGTPYGAVMINNGITILQCSSYPALCLPMALSSDGATFNKPLFQAGTIAAWMLNENTWVNIANEVWDKPITSNMDFDATVKWTNHDVLYVTSYNADDGSYTIGTEIARKSDVNYRVTGGYMTSIANEARRLGNTDAPMKPDAVESALRAADGEKLLPAAEDTLFGTVVSEHEYGLLSVGEFAGTWNNYGGGYEFTPNEDISVVGIRAWAGTANYTNTTVTAGLWDTSGNLLASCSFVRDTNEQQGFFDDPVDLKAGENYIVSADTWYMTYVFTSNVSINPKIAYVQGRTCSCGSSGGPTYPATEKGNGAIYGVADIIISQPAATVPNEYIVQFDTMNGIADEVKRIVGRTSQMSASEIYEELRSVPSKV